MENGTLIGDVSGDEAAAAESTLEELLADALDQQNA
jgi:hypothetical protein